MAVTGNGRGPEALGFENLFIFGRVGAWRVQRSHRNARLNLYFWKRKLLLTVENHVLDVTEQKVDCAAPVCTTAKVD
eukprot:3858433-Rhodomonas_salina.1